MIGIVTPDFEPIIRLRISGDTDDLELDFLVDTGFNGFLALPLSVTEQLNLKPVGFTTLTLADGAMRQTPTYLATAFWDEVSRDIRVLAIGDRPVLGLQLLKNHVLHIEIRDGGAVSLESLY
jgi:clan AA aspartic protease